MAVQITIIVRVIEFRLRRDGVLLLSKHILISSITILTDPSKD